MAWSCLASVCLVRVKAVPATRATAVIPANVDTFAASLAIYSQQPRSATKRETELAALLTQTASIIISQHTEHQARRHAGQDLREKRREPPAARSGQDRTST
jgi:GAF domain-containing protein